MYTSLSLFQSISLYSNVFNYSNRIRLVIAYLACNYEDIPVTPSTLTLYFSVHIVAPIKRAITIRVGVFTTLQR